MNHTNGNRSSFTGILGGLALGALAMYMFDPVQGDRRRAQMRDKLQGLKTQTRNTAEARYRDFKNRGQEAASAPYSAGAGEAGDTHPAAGEMSQSGSAP